MEGCEGSISQAEMVQRAGRTTLDQDIARLRQALHNGSACGAVDIQGDALFARVQVEKQGAVLSVWHGADKRAEAARHVPRAGGFDFDDLSSQTGEKFGTE